MSTDEAAESAGSWESARMPSFDYTAWSTNLQDTTGGIECVRQCLRETRIVLPLLKQIVACDFFSYYAVNLITPCMYFPTLEEGCDFDRCQIDAVRDRDVPPELRERDLSECGFMIDGWCRKDMPSDFTEYFDLRTFQSRDTGYDGSRVWRFIHTKICFTKGLEDPGNSWKRDYNRAVSGMHAAVNAEIIADLGTTEAGRAEYRRRLRDQPGVVNNLYYAYMLTLCALHECRSRLGSCSYLGDEAVVGPLMQQLLAAELLSNEAVQRAAYNLRSHAASPSAEVWRMRMRHRDLKQMMGCVECNLCRVHGTVMCLGLGATLQVLLGSDGRGGDPLALDRVQVAALMTTAAKLGAACETVEYFSEIDLRDRREAEAKAAWLARLDTRAWAPQARAAVPAAEGDIEVIPVAKPSEEDAKRVWLAKNVPAWGPAAVAASASAASTATAPPPPVSEDEAEGCELPGPPEEVECDVVIVGGGPAGCTCALYTSRANLNTIILDKNPGIGALAITSHIANFPGFGTVRGDELLNKMREHAIEHGADYRRSQVFLVDIDGEKKSVYTPDTTYHARAIVLATGGLGRAPSLPGEGELLGNGVSYCATCDGAFYCGQEIAVIGSNQEAIEEADFLTNFASTVHWITQVDPKADDAHAHALLSRPNVKHWRKMRVERIEGDASTGVTGLRLKPRGGDADLQQLAVEGVFVYGAGSQPITDFLEDKVAINDDGGVRVNEDMETSVPGVFAIGDIRNKPLKQAVVAAADGCIAALSVDRYIKGRNHVRVDWVHK